MEHQDQSQNPPKYPAAVVIDTGSSTCRAGFAGEDNPKVSLPTIVGRPKHITMIGGFRDFYIGEEAQAKRPILKINFPVQDSYIIDWDDMEKIWHHIFFNELRVDLEEHPVMLTEPVMNFSSQREKMIQVMFETFNVPAFFAKIPAVLSLYASGKTTGLVLDSGYDITHAVPIIEGYKIPNAVLKIDLGGAELTHYMVKILEETGTTFTTTRERMIAADIKEKLCYVAKDFNQELEEVKERPRGEIRYTLPDGQQITLGNQLFRCPEVLFQHSEDLRTNYQVIPQLICKSVNRCDPKDRAALFENILLAGGTTMFEGIQDRLQKELIKLTPETAVKVEAPENRQLSAWIGGSMLASLSSFQDQWITKEEYEEIGPSIILKKCL